MVAAQRRRARLLLELGRADEALAEIRRVLATHPNDPESLEIEGSVPLRRRDLPTGARDPRRAIAAAPDGRTRIISMASRCASRAARARPRRRSARRSQRCPDEPVYLRALAELTSELGRHGEALTLARRATEVAPERAANFVTSASSPRRRGTSGWRARPTSRRWGSTPPTRRPGTTSAASTSRRASRCWPRRAFARRCGSTRAASARSAT